ncbi:MAG: T9SS sorting signal type C domain-containing protein, partial [Sphingobacteriales bacterium]
LYTDTALTQAYVSGTNAVSVYAAPTAAQMYMATTSNGATCTKTGFATVTVPGKRYTGTTTDWFAANNWTPAGVPAASDCVIIPTGKTVTVSGDTAAHAAALSLQGTAKLTVVAESTLKVENSVVVAPGAELKVLNNAALQQSDLAAGNTNSGVMQLHRDSNSLFRLDYTMWASPVVGQNLYDFSTGTLTTRFYFYNSGTGHYVAIDPEDNDFDPATGYLIRMPNGSDVPGYIAGDAPMVFNGVFTGKPNNGDIPVALSTIGDRYTAIGNPYPSPISLQGFFSGGQNLLDEASPIYLWRKTNESANPSYATLTTTAYAENEAPGGGGEMADFYTEGNEANWMLAPGQGFIVKTAANAAQGTFTFKNLMRRPAVAGGTPFFRDMQNPASRFWLDLTNDTNARSQAAIVYKDGATTGIDYSMDGRHYPSNGIALYSLVEDTNLTIQTRPAFDAEDVVPMGYIAIIEGQYSISLRRFDGLFNTAQKIYLKDNLTGTTHNLKDSDYTFTSVAGTFNSRFEVIYAAPPALDTKTPADIASSVIVYKNNGIINVSSPNASISTVTVFDIRGRKLFEQNDVNANATSLTGFTAEQQVLIINVTTDKGEVSKKIVY